MMSHGRGRGMRPAAENNGSVGGEAGSTTGSDADSKSQDDRFEDDIPGSEDNPQSPSTGGSGESNNDIESLLKLVEEGEDIRGISKTIKTLCTSEKALREVVEHLNTKSKEEKEYGSTAAKAFGNISQFEVSGIKLRDAVLRCIQNDFKNREELKSKSDKEYLLSVHLLCQVYQNMRLADGTYINILSVPILEYFTALLTNPTSQAIEIIGEQTHMIGEEIQRSKPEKFAEFLVKVRKLIVEANPSLDIKSRCHLLHVLESHLLRWPSMLPEKTGEFYCSVLGDHVLTRATTNPHPVHAKSNSQDGSSLDAANFILTSPGSHVTSSSGGGLSTTRRVAQADPIPRNPNQFRHPPAPSPGMFTQPPPMLPPNFAAGAPPHGGGGMMRSPRGMGVHQPPRQTQPGGMPPGHWQHNRVEPGNPGGGLLMQDHQLERVAADIMAIRMPHTQVSPPVRHQPQGGAGMLGGRQSGAPGGGWQAMPPSIPPHLPPGNIPTAIVPPGVPPHNMPPRNMATVLPARDDRLGGPGGNMNNWANPPPNLPSASVSPTPHGGGKHPDMFMGQRQPQNDVYRGGMPSGRSMQNISDHALPGGMPHTQQHRSGGSGRILPGADGGWSSGGSGAGPMQPQQKEWSSGGSMSNRENPRGSGFVIDTWESSAGGSGAGGEGSRSSGPRSDGSNSLAGDRTGGSGSMWSAGGGQEASNQWTDRSERSNSVGWGNDKGMNQESRGRNNWDNRREDSSIGHWGGPPAGTPTGEPKPEQQWGSANMDKPQTNDWGNNGTSNWSNSNQDTSGSSNWNKSDNPGSGGAGSNWSNADISSGGGGVSNWNDLPDAGSRSRSQTSGSPAQQNWDAQSPSGWGKDGGDVGLQKSSNNWMSGGGGQPDSSIGEWGGGGGTGSTQSSSSINNSRGGQNTPSSGWGNGGSMGGEWSSGGDKEVHHSGGRSEWGMGGAAGPGSGGTNEWSSGGGGGVNSGVGASDWGKGDGSNRDGGITEWSAGGGGNTSEWGKSGGDKGVSEWGKVDVGGGGAGGEWSKDTGVADWSKESGGAKWSDLTTS